MLIEDIYMHYIYGPWDHMPFCIWELGQINICLKFLAVFMKLHIVKFFSDINMLYKFGSVKKLWLWEDFLFGRKDGRTDADCFYIPLQRCWRGIITYKLICHQPHIIHVSCFLVYITFRICTNWWITST